MQYIKITRAPQKITIRVIKDILRVIERKIMLKKSKENRNWKEDKIYLKELQIFLDQAENIEDEILKKTIIYQMQKCDNTLTKVAENKFWDCYKLGYNNAKKEEI